MKNLTGLLRGVALFAAVAVGWGCDDATSSGGGDAGADATPGVGGEGGGAGGMGGGAGGMGGVGGNPVVTCITDAECQDNEYCFVQDGDLEGICNQGCRQGGCPEGQFCDLTAEPRVCVDEPCEGDAECPAGTYCKDGGCEEGCRTDPDTCQPTENGQVTECDPDSRECVALLPCCSADNTCSEVREDACDGTVLRGVAACVVDGLPDGTDVCTDATECEADDDCGAGLYCNQTDNRCYPGCRRDDASTCPDNQVCDDKNRCVDLPCTEDGDCPDNFFCNDALLCNEGCRIGGCAAGECNPETRECEESCDPEVPNACGPGQVCDGGRGNICVEECGGDDSCPPDQFCNVDTGLCVTGCRDDDNEDDDDQASATDIMLGAEMDGIRTGTVQGAILCAEDAGDFYAITLNAGERMRVSANYEDNGIDTIDLRLHGDSIADGPLQFDGQAVPEAFEYPPLGTDLDAQSTFYIEVYGDVEARLPYTLTVQVGVGVACFPDDNEPNDRAADGPIQPMNNFEYLDQTICGDDEDWFCVDMGVNFGLTVTLTAESGSDALGLEIFSLTRAQQAGGLGNPNFGEADVTTRDIPAGTEYSFNRDPDTASFSDETWCARVRPDVDGAVARYDLRVQATPGGDCGNDSNTEPNDTRMTAVDLDMQAAITTGGLLNSEADLEVPLDLEICARDVDFFCFTAEADDIIQAWAVGDGVAGELAVQFFDPAGVPVGREARHTAPGEMPEKAEVAGTLAGRYCVSVDGQGPAQGPYDLFVRRDPVGEGVCAADRIEVPDGPRNDSARTATPLPDVSPNGTRFEFQQGYICDPEGGADFDWYSFPVAEANSAVCVMIDGFDDDRSNVQAELFNGAGNPNGDGCANDAACGDGLACVAGRCTAPSDVSTTGFDFELMKLARAEVADRTGDYLVRVSHGDDGESAYNLAVTVQPAADPCPDDWQELGDSNDDQNNPTFLGAGQVGLCDAWICNNERNRQDGDWYEITVPANTDRTIVIDYSFGGEGQLAMELYGDLFEDPADEFSNYVKSELGQLSQQCINIRGGDVEMDARLHVWLAGGAFVGDGNRVDYSIRVVPTDLDVNPNGACAVLGANPDIAPCPPRAEWQEIPGLGRIQPNDCWPAFTVVAP